VDPSPTLFTNGKMTEVSNAHMPGSGHLLGLKETVSRILAWWMELFSLGMSGLNASQTMVFFLVTVVSMIDTITREKP